MSAYTEEFLVDKLSKLVNTQESIQTLSEWVKFHKKKCDKSVEVWDRELYKASKERKLVFLYLANDIMQTSRKRGGEFIKEFAKFLPRSILHVHRECDKEDKKSVSRLLNIWQERRVFTPEYIDGIIKSLNGEGGPSDQLNAHMPAELDAPPMSPPNKNDPLVTLMRAVAGREVELALAEEKVQAIRPQLMSGEALITCLNQSEVTELAIELDDAISVLGSFHKSLEEDVKSRGKLIEAIKVFMETQQQQKESTQKRLQEYTQELSKTEALKEQLKKLYEKLPPGPVVNEEAQPSIFPFDPRTQSPQKRSSTSEDSSSPEKRAKFQPTTNTISPNPQALLPSPNITSRTQLLLSSIPNMNINSQPNSHLTSQLNLHPNPLPLPTHPNSNHSSISNPLLSHQNYYPHDPNAILSDINMPVYPNHAQQTYPLNQNLNNMNLNNNNNNIHNNSLANNNLHLQGLNQPPPLNSNPHPIPDYQNYLSNDQYSQLANYQFGYIKPVQ